MFERFTEGARQAIVLAQEEARKLCHNYIGTEHLLLGVLREGGAGAGLLGTAGVSFDAARARVVASEGPGTSGQIPFTRRARGVLEQALREALRLGHDHIGTEHLVLGLLADSDGVAATILDDLGASRSTIEAEVADAPPDQWAGVTQSGFATAASAAEPPHDMDYDECVVALQAWDGRDVTAVWPAGLTIDRPYRGRLSLRVESADRSLLAVSVEPPDERLTYPGGFSVDVWREEFGGGRWVGEKPDAGLSFILAATRVAIFPD